MNPVNVPAIGAYIREQREQARISLRQLAQATGVSNPYLSQIERGLRKPSADILQQLAKGLRISAEVLYVQAGFLEDRPAGQGVRDAVLADPELTERQKQMLIEIYDSFRNETAPDGDDGKDGEAAGPGDRGLDPAALAWPEMTEDLGAAEAAEEPPAPAEDGEERAGAPADGTLADGRQVPVAGPKRATARQAARQRSAERGAPAQTRRRAPAPDAAAQAAAPEVTAAPAPAAADTAAPAAAAPGAAAPAAAAPAAAAPAAAAQPAEPDAAAQAAAPDAAAQAAAPDAAAQAAAPKRGRPRRTAQHAGPGGTSGEKARSDQARPSRSGSAKSGTGSDSRGSQATRARPSAPATR